MVLLTGHLSHPPIPFLRLCEQDIRGLIESKAGKIDASSGPKTDAPPMLRQLKPAEVDEIVRLYEADADRTPEQLAAHFGVHRTTVTYHLRRRGVTIRPRVPAMSAEDIETAARLYRSGSPLSQLSAKFQVADGTVARNLRKAGVALRPKTGG